MLFAYESPGMNAVNWLLEKSLKPEALDFVKGANEAADVATKIQWGLMFTQIIQMATLGLCAMFILEVFGMREVGKMCMWLAAVECFAIVAKAISG